MRFIAPENVHPVIILQDHWCGAYSGNMWLAINAGPLDIPLALSVRERGLAEEFWAPNNPENKKVGRGSTPQAALEDLFKRMGGNAPEIPTTTPFSPWADSIWPYTKTDGSIVSKVPEGTRVYYTSGRLATELL